jgi:hypothetical protein
MDSEFIKRWGRVWEPLHLPAGKVSELDLQVLRWDRTGVEEQYAFGDDYRTT